MLLIDDRPSFAKAVIHGASLVDLAERCSPSAMATALRRVRALVLVDVTPGAGVRPAELARAGRASRRVLAYSAESLPGLALDVVSRGALFVDVPPSDAPPSAFVGLVRRLVANAIAERDGTEERKLGVARALAKRCGLTLTEGNVLELIAAGHVRSDLAGELGVGARTMKSHVRNILDKVAPVVRERDVRALECWIVDEALYDAEVGASTRGGE